MKDPLGTLLYFQRQLQDMERHPERYGGPCDDYANQAAVWLRAEAEGRELLKLQGMGRAEAFALLHRQPPTPMAILWLIDEAKRQAVSARASSIAKAKNHKPIAQTREAWKKAKLDDPKLSKRAFADAIAPGLAKKPHWLTVRPETIAYFWLKGL